MKTVIIGVATREEISRGIVDAVKTGKQRQPRISFPTHELFWKILTPKRMDLLRSMAGAGPLGVRDISRAVKRDVRTVHADLTALLNAGIIDRAENSKYEFPYDAIHVDFTVKPTHAHKKAAA